MNIASAELFQNSLQNLGNSFQRRREEDALSAYRQQMVDEAKNKTQLEDDFRRAQLARTAAYQDKALQAENDKNDVANRRADASEKAENDKFGLMKAAQEFSQKHQLVQEAQQQLPAALKNIRDKTQDLAESVVNGDTPPDEATQQFKDAIDGIGKDNPQLQAQLMQVPNLQKVYSGDADWGQLLTQIKQQNAAESAAAQPKPASEVSYESPTDPSNPNAPKYKATIKNPQLSADDINRIVQSSLPPTQQNQPAQWQIDKLRANPNMAADFDKKFGAGASNTYLSAAAPNPAPGNPPAKPLGSAFNIPQMPAGY